MPSSLTVVVVVVVVVVVISDYACSLSAKASCGNPMLFACKDMAVSMYIYIYTLSLEL